MKGVALDCNFVRYGNFLKSIKSISYITSGFYTSNVKVVFVEVLLKTPAYTDFNTSHVKVQPLAEPSAVIV